MPAVLEVSDLCKSFGGVRALRGCSFAVEGVAITGIVGPNGAGKSTLFDVITGFLAADRGEVRLNGRCILCLPPAKIARLGVARTFQDPRLFGKLTVSENVSLGAWRPLRNLIADALGIRRAKEGKPFSSACRELLSKAGMQGKMADRADTLSFGQQKLVELARSFNAGPRLLLLDEPASGIHRNLRSPIAEILRGMAAQGATIVLIEHDLRFVRETCDHVIVLHEGMPIFCGDVASMFSDRHVRETYLSTGAVL